MKPVRVLIIDDEEHICSALARFLRKENYDVSTAKDGEHGLELFRSEQPDIVLTDVSMPKIDGLAFLQIVRDINKEIPVIILTGSGTVRRAMQAMQLGATDYITKPFSVQMVVRVVNNIAQGIRLGAEVNVQKRNTSKYEMLGSSVPMQTVGKLIGAVSLTPNHTSVLVLGESGTGKELVARVVHESSPHAAEPFIALNCAALPENLLESELFGHEKGAFTGAAQQRVGKFEAAGSGTIFLDEIGELSMNLQQKLLRVLQEREFERIGGNTVLPVKARFIAATNRDLQTEVKAGRFREDLFYRLNVFPIVLPPLRDRGDDILPLAEHFLVLSMERMGKTIRGFSQDARELLLSYPFPGNVRELENTIERAVALTGGQALTADALPQIQAAMAATTSMASMNAHGRAAEVSVLNGKAIEGETLPSEANEMVLLANTAQMLALQSSSHVPSVTLSSFDAIGDSGTRYENGGLLEEAQGAFEKQFIIRQLSKHGGNVSETAAASGMTRQNLYYLLKKHGIRAEDYRLRH